MAFEKRTGAKCEEEQWRQKPGPANGSLSRTQRGCGGSSGGSPSQPPEPSRATAQDRTSPGQRHFGRPRLRRFRCGVGRRASESQYATDSPALPVIGPHEESGESRHSWPARFAGTPIRARSDAQYARAVAACSAGNSHPLTNPRRQCLRVRRARCCPTPSSTSLVTGRRAALAAAGRRAGARRSRTTPRGRCGAQRVP